MRITVTLDDDVVAELERFRRARNLRLKDAVNELFRRGLREVVHEGSARKPFHTRTFDLGESLVDVTCVARAIAFAEGEDHK